MCALDIERARRIRLSLTFLRISSPFTEPPMQRSAAHDGHARQRSRRAVGETTACAPLIVVARSISPARFERDQPTFMFMHARRSSCAPGSCAKVCRQRRVARALLEALCVSFVLRGCNGAACSRCYRSRAWLEADGRRRWSAAPRPAAVGGTDALTARCAVRSAADGGVEDLERFLEHLVLDGERKEEAKHVAVAAAGEQQQPPGERASLDGARLVGVR